MSSASEIRARGERVMEDLLKTLRFVCRSEFWRMAVLWTLALIASYFQLFIGSAMDGKSKAYSHFKSHFFESGTRPVCIVTGVDITLAFATSGLGAALSHTLAREGFFVVLVGRSNLRLSMVMQEILKENKDAKVRCFEADMASFSSISEFKASFEKWLVDMDMHLSVQLLINNAAILAKEYRSTADGLEEMMATNYVGAFCLTDLLLPLLTSSPVPARIINVTSFTHRNVLPRVSFPYTMLSTVRNMQVDKEFVAGKCFSKSTEYPFAHIYEYSKLCLVLFTNELHRQLSSKQETSHIFASAADPGAVETNIMREIPPLLSCFAVVVLKLLGLLQQPADGIRSVLDAAFSPPDSSGSYFFGGNGRAISSSGLSYESDLGEKLWKASSDLLIDLKLASKLSITAGVSTTI